VSLLSGRLLRIDSDPVYSRSGCRQQQTLYHWRVATMHVVLLDTLHFSLSNEVIIEVIIILGSYQLYLIVNEDWIITRLI